MLAGTGYRVDLVKLGFLEAGLRQRIRLTGSFPQLSRSFESSARGLYFVGPARGGHVRAGYAVRLRRPARGTAGEPGRRPAVTGAGDRPDREKEA